MKKLLLSNVMLWIAIALFSCKGDQGAAGPAGANGVANISNTTFTISPGSWNNPQSGAYTYGASVPAITDFNNDDVQCYVQASNGGAWIALPVTNLFYVGDEMEFGVNSANVTLVYYNSSAPTVTIALRVVVIPPTEVAKMKLHNVNLKDYDQVNAYIQLNSK